MTDTHTEIKAINEELEAINQCLETFAILPNTALGDRLNGKAELASSVDVSSEVSPQADGAEPSPSKTIELPLAAPSGQSSRAKEVLAELARSQPSAHAMPLPQFPKHPAPPVEFLRSSSPPTLRTAEPTAAAIAISDVDSRLTSTAQSSSVHIPAFAHLEESATEPILSSVFDEKLRDLDTQAEYVNHLAEQQVTALLRLKAIAESAEFEAIRAGILKEPGSREQGWLRDHQLATVSFVELDDQGCWGITNQPVDWFQSERDSVMAAEQLRHLQKRRSYTSPAQTQQGRSPKPFRVASQINQPRTAEPTLQARVQHWVKQGVSRIQHETDRFEGRSRLASARLGRLSPLISSRTAPVASTSAQPSTSLPAGIQFPAFILWIAGAAAVRISLNILAAVAPSLVPIAIIGVLGLGGWVVYKMLAK
jgi:hypothetical protein